jgi:hypothetical protein
MKLFFLLFFFFLLSSPTILISSSDNSSAETIISYKKNIIFHESSFLNLIEEYTTYSRTRAKDASEDPIISNFIDRLETQTNNIEQEISSSSINRESVPTKKQINRLKHYNSAAKTALKDLQKRQCYVQFLKQNTQGEVKPETSLAQNNQNIFPNQNKIRECLLHSPTFMNC